MQNSIPPLHREVVQLRDYQLSAIERLRAAIRDLLRAQRESRVLLVSPTGSGKGTIASFMIASASGKGKRILFLVNRRELVKDLSRRLFRLGINHGIIMGDHPSRPWLSVQIASIDTLHRRSNPPAADLIFVDEAHFSISPTWGKVIALYPGVPVIGMTATPIRADGRGLGDLFGAMVECPSVAALTEIGHLAPAKIFAPPAPILTGVKVQAGDYNQKQLAQAVDKGKLIGDIVAHWFRHGRGRPTILFAVNVKHSKHTAEKFNEAGARWKHVDANTPDDERDHCWADLASGALDGISSVGIVSYGWDVPAVSCAILARPTKSLALFLQQIGRVLRPYPGKDYALILDHSGATHEHGLPDDERDWSLSGERRTRKKPIDRALSVRMCLECWMAFRSTEQSCPACGWIYVGRTSEIKTAEGELQEIDAAKRAMKISANPAIAYLQRVRVERAYRPGWVWHRMQQFLDGRSDILPPHVVESWKKYARAHGQASVVAAFEAKRSAAVAPRVISATELYNGVAV